MRGCHLRQVGFCLTIFGMVQIITILIFFRSVRKCYAEHGAELDAYKNDEEVWEPTWRGR